MYLVLACNDHGDEVGGVDKRLIVGFEGLAFTTTESMLTAALQRLMEFIVSYLINRGRHPELGCCILPSTVASDTLS